MKRPIWFKRDGAAHWVPCAWQGWLAVAAYVVLVTGGMVWAVDKRAANPALIICACLAATAALLALVISTDDTRRRD